MDSPTRTVERCLVCGFTEVRTDEVVDRGLVFLSECPRCDHRWTRAALPEPAALGVPRPVRPARVVHPEVASAA
jgi:hypothetical protein